MNCKNCNNEVTQNYCPNCGKVAKLNRIDGRYIIQEIEHVLEFERGILFTVRELVIRPGEIVRDFISENRSRLVKPIIFIILTSLFYSLIIQFFQTEDSNTKFYEKKHSSTELIFAWVQGNYGYANIIMGIFIAFWTKLFFRKYQYNYFEILILLCFVMGIGMLIYAFFAIFQGLTHIDFIQIASFIFLFYSTWAIGQFFDKSKFSNYVKALFSYILGFISFSLTAILIGTSIDLIIKH